MIIREDHADLRCRRTRALTKTIFVIVDTATPSKVGVAEQIQELTRRRTGAQELLRTAAADIAGINAELRLLERITDGCAALVELSRTEAITSVLRQSSEPMSPRRSTTPSSPQAGQALPLSDRNALLPVGLRTCRATERTSRRAEGCTSR